MRFILSFAAFAPLRDSLLLGFVSVVLGPRGASPAPAATSPVLQTLRETSAGSGLELLKEAVPKLARVAVLYDLGNPAGVREVKELLPVAAHALKLIIQPWEVRVPDDFDKVFAAMGKQRLDGLYVAGASPTIVTNQKRIVGFALKRRLPSAYSNRNLSVAAGSCPTGPTKTKASGASLIMWTES